MRIALAQLSSGIDPAANLAELAQAVGRASDLGAELVVAPEATMCSFARPRIDVAEMLDGPWASGVDELARGAGISVVVGMFTTTGGPRVRNTLLVTGPGVRTHYDKLHLFDALGYAESDQIEPGDAEVTFNLGGTTIGLTTCYDVRFPALYTSLANAGATVILVPASWAPGPGKVQQWRTLVQARALDSTSWIVAVGQAHQDAPDGQRPRPTGVGHSMVVSPLGEVVLELGDQPEVAVVDVDPSLAHTVREQLPVLVNGRYRSALAPGGTA